MISIKGLNKFYNKGRQNEIHVLNDINLELPDRGMVAIYGKSGCGKTTLLNVIGGLDKFAGGDIKIQGEAITKEPDEIRNKYIGYIFQNYNLNPAETCYDNIAAALILCGITDEKEIESRVMAALRCVNMEKYEKRTPDTLSGGQQQRIAIARAIVKNPAVILADEPTGNLDEANTVMIMDLLKSISQEHLVLLVTHEANLVDYYCDMIINLEDGKVVSVRNNEEAFGFEARDKNHIYLGELAKSSISDETAHIDYYGEKPQTPINIRIINNSGQLFVQIGSEKIRVIDNSSEIKVIDGVYQEKVGNKDSVKKIDLSDLPPIQSTKTGSLFNVKSSIKSGYKANFKNNKKGKKVLRACLCLFAVVIVFMTANFGTSIKKILNASDAHNHNVFYVLTEDANVSQKLNEAMQTGQAGIDYIRLSKGFLLGDSYPTFRTGNFETFSRMDYDDPFQTNAVYLGASLLKDKPLIVGKKDNLGIGEIVISSRVADKLLEKAALGYIKEYDDLLGMLSMGISIESINPRVVGIVESDEPAVYLNEIAMAKYAMVYLAFSRVQLAKEYGYELKTGETILLIKMQDERIDNPVVGETIMIQGRPLTVTAILQTHTEYGQWLKAKGIAKDDAETFFEKIVKEEYPEIGVEDDKFYELLDRVSSEKQYDYYDYLFTEIDDFYREYLSFEPSNFDLWLYLEKGIENAKYMMLPTDYFKAVKYKEMYGKYPTVDQLNELYNSLPYVEESLKAAREMYSQEFYGLGSTTGFSGQTYIVSDEDYIAFSKQIGQTHKSAEQEQMYLYVDAIDIADIADTTEYNKTYTVVHSNNPEITEQWLNSEMPSGSFVTPNDIFKTLIKEEAPTIVANIISLCVIFALMCICMYFIMRSSLMNRIKEIGVYRAIGVSRKNLIFKFLVEAFVLTTLTILLGYLFVSGFLMACFGLSSMMSQIFYYPVWIALIILAVLYGVCLLFGIIPIMSLLRKTPSEIIAKYDI